MSGYYDIDGIIADGQKVPVIFNFDLPGLGYLQGNQDDIKQNSKLDLPLWIAEILYVNGIDGYRFVEIPVPPPFQVPVMNALKSDAKSLDLGALCPVYFKLAQRWVMLTEEGADSSSVLIEALRERINLIADFAHNVRNENSHFLELLDSTEKALHKTAQSSVQAARNWRIADQGQ